MGTSPCLPRFPSPVVLLALLLALGGATSSAFAQSAQLTSGFVLDERFSYDPRAPFAKQFAAVEYGPDCSLIVYEAGEVRVHAGADTTVLVSFDPVVFGSFLRLAPDGASVYFGESSSGDIYRVRLDGGGATITDNISFSFDLDFAPTTAGEVAGRGFVSGLGAQALNAIWLLDEDGEEADDIVIADIPRFSGPLVFDDAGNLYYVTIGASGADFGADEEFGQRLVRFTSSQLETGVGTGAVAFSEGEVLLRDLDGFFGMVWVDGVIYGSNLGFVTGAGTIDTVDTLNEFDYSTFASFGAVSASQIAFCPGPAGFTPGEGVDGGRLALGLSNFIDTTELVEITPELWFERGRINGDDRIDIGDAIYLLTYLFSGGDEPHPIEAGDVNADDEYDVSDALYLLSYLFLQGPEPPAPFGEPGPAPRA